MSAAFFYHDLAGTRQGATSGLRELQQLSCQGMDASLVHQSSFQVRLVDEFHLIDGSTRHVGSFTQGRGNV